MDPARAQEANVEGVRILATGRHRNKLRVGHLHGNRFEICLGDVAENEGETIANALSELAVRGVPNRYGYQRFGSAGDNVEVGLGEEGFRAKRARRIAVLNQKGGTGKTTTAVNLAAGLAERDHECLLIDTDAQGNVGVSLGVAGERSLYHVLVESAERGVARQLVCDVGQGSPNC